MAEFNELEICRLCLASAERLGELSQHITYIISTCFSLKIYTSSELTNKICQVCIDQLNSVYKYRTKIIRNELILLRKLRRNVTNDSETWQSENLQIDTDIDRFNNDININELVDITHIADDESGPDESNTRLKVYEDSNTKVQKQEQCAILQHKKDIHELKKKQQRSSLNGEGFWSDTKIGNKDLHHTQALQSDFRGDSLINSLGNQHNLQSNNWDETNKNHIENPNKNKNSLEEDKIATSLIRPNIFKTDKENADVNTSPTNDSTNIENASTLNEGKVTSITLNQNPLYVINTDKKFMCLTCLEVFRSQKELSIHYKTVEFSKTAKEISRKHKDINIVSKNAESKTVFMCGACNKVFETKASAIKHTQVHKVERPFLCNLCSRTYKTVADILRHGVVHNDFKFTCPNHCGYATVHLGALREHVKRHKKEYKYKCEKCGKCFQVKTWYDQHQNVHNQVRPFVCRLCGQAFSMARYLTAHQANVHPQSSKVKRYKCVQCALPCDSPKSLVMHMKQKHGLKTDCLCDVCGQILPDQQKLILHKSVHEASRKFSCRFCKKTFNKNNHKTVHEKIHTGERLSCNHCPKSFTQRCSLRRHMKRYHQEHQPTLEEKT